ncbi:polyisoprenoid-binding protein YceI [Nonlabens dokdonensis]|uniref:YCE I like family protein n=2 Tax=Nonlabens dokdonensis TaxID=328515 RepID=L7WB58_NONDD|nr:YceI family protein [Nonlabens dokdonensis]AGC77437.1 YCE I like family protein [Nonlabens dokdonensis DSW-6]PZX40961.1 polyisoprenoid-binding protein YceI [Nonlabens dokdonensis]
MKTVNTTKSTAVWTGKKFGGSHTGTIQLQEGNLDYTDDKISGGFFKMNMDSLHVTDLEGEMKGKLEGHLKSDDFFSTATHPTANLVITSISKDNKGIYQATGDLTIKGITNPINFQLLEEGDKLISTLIIDRSKYDVKYGSKSFFKGLGDNFIHDNFEVVVTLEF